MERDVASAEIGRVLVQVDVESEKINKFDSIFLFFLFSKTQPLGILVSVTTDDQSLTGLDLLRKLAAVRNILIFLIKKTEFLLILFR